MLELSDSPKHHPDCCLSLSSKLFRTIQQIVQNIARETADDVLLISVGCGSGLFEATLGTHLAGQGLTNVRVEGIEVLTTRTPYLPNERLHRVQGTREICGHAQRADILIFVYPRTGQLIRQYLEHLHRSAALVLWLGPKADWVEQKPMLHNVATFEEPTILEQAGLVQYEVAVLFKNTAEHVNQSKVAADARTELPLCEDIDSI